MSMTQEQWERECDAEWTNGDDLSQPQNHTGYVQAPEINLKPHKCPVCEGRGEVGYNFYDSVRNGMNNFACALDTIECRSCKGAGYLLIGA